MVWNKVRQDKSKCQSCKSESYSVTEQQMIHIVAFDDQYANINDDYQVFASCIGVQSLTSQGYSGYIK